MKTLGMIVLALAMTAGCGKKKDEPPATAGSATEVAGSAAGSGSAVGSGSADVAAGSGSDTGSAAQAILDLPTAMDYEEEVSGDITEKNLEARIKALETETAE